MSPPDTPIWPRPFAEMNDQDAINTSTHRSECRLPVAISPQRISKLSAVTDPFPPSSIEPTQNAVVGTDWSRPVTDATAHRRAAGRRAVNARRRFLAARRRSDVVRLLGEQGMSWGAQAAIARALGVHRSTICRDLREVFGHMKPESKEAR